jgi:1-acyl-sn-glycerol-3-phosphate acyltransferase
VKRRAPIYRLAGTNFGVERLRDLPRLAVAASWLMGPAARRVISAGRAGDARIAEARWARHAARALGMRLSIHGTHRIDRRQTYVVAPLHEGFADIIALLHLGIPLRFAARDELGEWPSLGAALASGGHVMIDPEQPRAAYRTLRRAAPDIRDRGENVVIFPQGSLLGIETAFTEGAFAIAAATAQPILPVVVTGTHRVWEHPFSPVVRFGQPVRLQVLAPIRPPFDPGDLRALEQKMKAVALSQFVAPRRYRPDQDGFWDGYRFAIDPAFSEVYDAVAHHRASNAPTPGSLLNNVSSDSPPPP